LCQKENKTFSYWEVEGGELEVRRNGEWEVLGGGNPSRRRSWDEGSTRGGRKRACEKKTSSQGKDAAWKGKNEKEQRKTSWDTLSNCKGITQEVLVATTDKVGKERGKGYQLSKKKTQKSGSSGQKQGV